jgi:hypothetical protein
VRHPKRRGAWAVPWWDTLGNVRSLVDYRTRMEIADQVVEAYGDRLRDNESIVYAWLSTVGDYYTGDLQARVSSGVMRPLGRPAAMTLCDREDDTINTQVIRTQPDCLQIHYYDDVL